MAIELPTLFPHQEDLRDRTRAALAKHGRVILCAQTGVGKCLGYGTPVILSHGDTIAVERLRVGDRLLGPTTPNSVISVCSGRAPLYKIVPTGGGGGGDSFVCNGDHILCLKLTTVGTKTCGGVPRGSHFTMTVDDFLSQSPTFRKHAKGYRCAAVEFEKPPHWSEFYRPPLDPYFVGIWLADGSTRDPEITTADEAVIAHLEAMCRLWGMDLVLRGWTGKARTFALTDRSSRGNFVRERLRDCVYDGRKFVATPYKIASVNDRLALLAGFIDGDGHLSQNCYDIAQKSPQLAKDIVFIARSVGLRATIRPSRKQCVNNGVWGDYCRITISGDTHVIPCRIPYKRAKPRRQNKNPLVFGFGIESLGEGEYFGFELDGDRQFCLGDFTVTHNTRTAKWILGASANRAPGERQTGRSLFVVHRRGLVENAIDSFSESPELPHGVIMSGCETAYGRRIQIASIDTMLSWFVENGEYPSDITFDLIVWDEAHAHHPKFHKFLTYHDAKRQTLGMKPAYVIGLTATPQAKGLADVYKEIVLGPSTEWLIENKYLSPFRYFKATQGKLGLLVKRGNEYTKESEALAMDGLAGDMVRDWKRFAEGRPTVGFFPRRSHAQDAMEQLSNAGLRVEYVDGETPDDVRRRIFRQLNEHDIDYLCNVQVIERGTDIPRISCVQLCVAIGSIARYRQMVGRGSRVHPAKTDCCVARGTMILTDRGEVPIQDVRLSDKVWDGFEFCSHGGSCCNGTKEVIEWGGLRLTLDHKVLTSDGWKKAGEAKAGSWRPISGGTGGTPIRTSDDSNPYDSRIRRDSSSGSRLLALRKTRLASILPFAQAPSAWMRALYAAFRRSLPGVGMEASSASAAAMPMPSDYFLRSLWRAWNRVSVCIDLRRGMLDCGESWTSAKQVMDDRPHRQQWALRTRQFAMGNYANSVAQSRLCLAIETAGNLPFRDVLRWAAKQPKEAGNERQANCGAMEVEVWDIQNAGPRNRYCANGVIIANCVVDHGGNVMRHGFFEDDPHWTLDISSQEPGEVGTRPTIECPKCEAIYRGGRCKNCGYEPTPKERRSAGLEFDGSELKEAVRTERAKSQKSPEELMISALYIAGKRGLTWKQSIGIYFGLNEKQGTRHRIPKTVTVGGREYAIVPYGSTDGGRRVATLYPFTAERGNHGGPYLLEHSHSHGEAW